MYIPFDFIYKNIKTGCCLFLQKVLNWISPVEDTNREKKKKLVPFPLHFSLLSDCPNSPLPIPPREKISPTIRSHRERERDISTMRRSGAFVRCCCIVVLAVTSALCVSAPALYWRYQKSFPSSLSSSSSTLSHSFVPFFGSGSIISPFPVLSWRRSTAAAGAAANRCVSCSCDCPPPLSLQTVAPALANISVADCGKDDPELHKELGKQPAELLTEELKLHEGVAEEQSRHANASLTDARRLAMQYQHEVEKCNMATEACEEARERSQVVLAKERKITALWEKRARQLGWQNA